MGATTINPLSLYGTYTKALPLGIGRSLFVTSSTNVSEFQQLFPAADGLSNVYTSVTSALADCVTGHGDTIFLDPNFTTALTATELLNAETKGVAIQQLGKQNISGVWFENRATNTLPQSTNGSIFTVTGKVKLLVIVGTVTTATPAGANNTKLTYYNSALSTLDICAAVDTASSGIGNTWLITGTLANAMVVSGTGTGLYQAQPLLIDTGTIRLVTDASKTGSVKWHVEYQPVDPGARIFAA